MDLCEFFTPDGSQPISYEEARAYFRRDPALSWAAYVAGALVVLMREKGLRPSDGISVLVSSAVPPGKGVSSSAALEVATMVALAAAYGVALEGRELALLCQKVENLVVGECWTRSHKPDLVSPPNCIALFVEGTSPSLPSSLSR